jgi:Tfp pilus assembly protein PilV
MDEQGGAVTGERGLSLVELLVAAMVATVVLGGLLSFYLATARSIGASAAQAGLQRQGTLALDEIARQVRGAVREAGSDPIAYPVTCNGRLDSVRINTASGPICYYAGDDGAL